MSCSLTQLHLVNLAHGAHTQLSYYGEVTNLSATLFAEAFVFTFLASFWWIGSQDKSSSTLL